MIKIASSDMDHFQKSGDLKDFHMIFSDLDRYCSDKYELDLVMRETKDDYSISCVAFQSHIGIACFTRYWHYKKNELDEANKTFDTTRKIVTAVRDEFEYNKVPPVLIGNRLAHALVEVDRDHRETSYIPSINCSRNEQYEGDIRKNIYGDRYAEHKIENHRDLVHQDQFKKVVTENSGRSKVVKYKTQF
jgi:hypothetical protein